jgi:ATP-dependent Clp protease ATP-binding subunit ClpA
MDDELSRTPRYTAVVNKAEQIAREMGHRHVGVEHLFLAIAANKRSIPTQVLLKYGCLPEAEADVKATMLSPGYSAPGEEFAPED